MDILGTIWTSYVRAISCTGYQVDAEENTNSRWHPQQLTSIVIQHNLWGQTSTATSAGSIRVQLPQTVT